MVDEFTASVGGVRGFHRKDHPNQRLQIVVCKPGPDVAVALSLQQEASRDHYIVRDGRIPGTPFLGEYMTTVSYERAYSGGPMRRDTLSSSELLLRYREHHPSEVILGFAGCGNVTMNPRFVAYAEGRLLYTEPDLKDRMSSFHRDNPSIVVWKTGSPTFARVRYRLTKPKRSLTRSGGPKILCRERSEFDIEIDGTCDRQDEVRFIAQGPPLVRGGAPIDEDDLIQMAKDGWFYDLRHVVQFPWVNWKGNSRPDKLPISVGLENMWKAGKIVEREIEKALRGRPVRIKLVPYTRRHAYVREDGKPVGVDPIKEALDAQSYRPSSDPKERGEYHIDQDAKRLTICLHRGIYNHSILGLSKKNELIWLGLGGLGNRVGVTMTDAATLATQNGMHNALLIDNGGDVMLNIREKWILPSTYVRTRFRGLLLFAASSSTVIPVADGRVPLDPL